MDPMAIIRKEAHHDNSLLSDDSETGSSHSLLLIEARYVELVSSIRALASSNQQLQEALIENPGDSDFLQAISENTTVIYKQRRQILNLVVDMKRQGSTIEVPEDIANMKREVVSGDVANEPLSLAHVENEDNTTSNNEAPSDEGIYL
jgi:hypothetical protein